MARPLEMRRGFAKRLAEALSSAGVPECNHSLHLATLSGASNQLPMRWLQGLAISTGTTL